MSEETKRFPASQGAESPRSRDGWWRDHLAVAFRAIVNREGLTRRHGVMRKITKRWGKRVNDLVG